MVMTYIRSVQILNRQLRTGALLYYTPQIVRLSGTLPFVECVFCMVPVLINIRISTKGLHLSSSMIPAFKNDYLPKNQANNVL